MNEAKVSFLLKAASIFSRSGDNKTLQILKSYYLSRSKNIIGPNLPKKYFSKEVRCKRCCIEWKTNTETMVKPIKLTKRQKQRIKFNIRKKKKPVNKEYLLNSHELVKMCPFCGYSMKSAVLKPNKQVKSIKNNKSNIVETTPVTKKKNKKESKPKNSETNLYCKSNVAFCLRKQKEVLFNTNPVKVAPKIIKNNKKKKDKLAGLSLAAVIAATKLKQDKEKQNKLNLFLKPSS